MLSRESVDEIHDVMMAAYGSGWFLMWEGVSGEAVAQDWQRRLSGLSAEAIAHGLSTLPPAKPPTAMQFREICLAVPVKVRASLAPPTHPPDPQRVAEIMSRLADVRKVGRLDWARQLRDREEAGEWLTPLQRTAWRTALEAPDGLSVPLVAIAVEKLPPAMRVNATPPPENLEDPT